MSAPREMLFRLVVLLVVLSVTNAGYGHGHLDYKVTHLRENSN